MGATRGSIHPSHHRLGSPRAKREAQVPESCVHATYLCAMNLAPTKQHKLIIPPMKARLCCMVTLFSNVMPSSFFGLCKMRALPLRNSPLAEHTLCGFVALCFTRCISQILPVASANWTSDVERYARRGPRLWGFYDGWEVHSSSGASQRRIPSAAGLPPLRPHCLQLHQRELGSGQQKCRHRSQHEEGISLHIQQLLEK
jgi:hypothetical protein